MACAVTRIYVIMTVVFFHTVRTVDDYNTDYSRPAREFVNGARRREAGFGICFAKYANGKRRKSQVCNLEVLSDASVSLLRYH